MYSRGAAARHPILSAPSNAGMAISGSPRKKAAAGPAGSTDCAAWRVRNPLFFP
jgi:hypothetical protein